MSVRVHSVLYYSRKIRLRVHSWSPLSKGKCAYSKTYIRVMRSVMKLNITHHYRDEFVYIR